MKKLTKVLSFLLTLAMVIGLMPGMSLTAWAEPVNPTAYNVWVGGTQVTSANAANIDGNNKVSYDAITNTLTLNGYSYSGHWKENEGEYSSSYVIYAKQALNIVLSGSFYNGFNRSASLHTGLFGV